MIQSVGRPAGEGHLRQCRKSDPRSKPAPPSRSGTWLARLSAPFFFLAGICFLGVPTGDPTNPAILSVISLVLMWCASIGAIVGKNPRGSTGFALAGLIAVFVAALLEVLGVVGSYVRYAVFMGIVGLVLSLMGIALLSRARKPVLR